MVHFEMEFSKFVQEPLCIYDLRDSILSLHKIGRIPRILNVLNVRFDRDLTLVDLMEEFPRIEGIYMSSDVDGRQLWGMRKLTQMKDLYLAFDGQMKNNQLRLPAGIRNIHIIPTCITNARGISDFLEKSLPGSSTGGVSLTLDVMQLVHNWDNFRIPKIVTQIGCMQRRNIPRELLKILKDSGFQRRERTEDMVVYERGVGAEVADECPEENLIDRDTEKELILKIIEEVLSG